ncbi:MAG: Gfo/Idh/MocA family oxidoreductase, partial [Mollicutes bacterium]|nr:Gfo/Idh/MocA family oxidoreductase [Mollicutes bacterium]
MEKRFKVCCIGLGHRGMCYLERMFLQKDRYELVAVCDINHERVRQAKEQFQLKEENCFYEENEFFAENRGDILIVATQDRDHVGHCIKALKLGYDILCEKP